MKAQFAPKKVQTVKYQPTAIAKGEYSISAHFKEYVQINVGGPGIHPEAFTIHRPIGATRLDNDEWVCTRTSDVHFLLSAEKDPDEAKYERIRQALILDYYLENSLLAGSKEKPEYPATKVAGITDRNARLAEAERMMRDDTHLAREKHDKDQIGKPKAAAFGYSKTKYDFMASDMKEYERSLKDASSKDPVLKEKIKNSKSSYETRGGMAHNAPQSPVPFLKKKNKDMVASEVLYKIQTLMGGAGKDPASTTHPQSKSEVEFQELQDYASKLTDYVLQVKAWKNGLAPLITSIQSSQKGAIPNLEKHLAGFPVQPGAPH